MMNRCLVVLVLLLAGCASTEAVLVNDKGDKRYCYKPASGAFSNIGATREFTKCLNDAGAAGYKQVEK